MTLRRIIVTDLSPQKGDFPPVQILEVEIKGEANAILIATLAICNQFKERPDHSVLVEDITSTRNVVYSKER